MDDAPDSFSASQESLYDENEFDSDRPTVDDTMRVIGLGKGKPYSASKIAKKRLGLTTGISGRPKGIGKVQSFLIAYFYIHRELMYQQNITKIFKKLSFWH